MTVTGPVWIGARSSGTMIKLKLHNHQISLHIRYERCKCQFRCITALVGNCVSRRQATMPVSATYTWEDNESTVVVTVPLKGASRKTVDIVVTDVFVKVNFAPYLLLLDLHASVDDESSKAVFKDGALELVLPKVTPGLWPELTVEGLSKKDLRARRDKAMVAKTEREQALAQKKKDARHNAEQLAMKREVCLRIVVRCPCQRSGDELSCVGLCSGPWWMPRRNTSRTSRRRKKHRPRCVVGADIATCMLGLRLLGTAPSPRHASRRCRLQQDVYRALAKVQDEMDAKEQRLWAKRAAGKKKTKQGGAVSESSIESAPAAVEGGVEESKGASAPQSVTGVACFVADRVLQPSPSPAVAATRQRHLLPSRITPKTQQVLRKLVAPFSPRKMLLRSLMGRTPARMKTSCMFRHLGQARKSS